MKKFILTAILAVTCELPAIAQDVDNCDSYPNVPVNITPIFDEPRYDFSQNLTAIQAIASDKSHSIPQYHSVTMGITRYEPVLEFHIPVTIETPPDGPACAHVNHVDVTIGYRDVTVFIASDIPENSCGFTETMGHEQKHIAVNRRLLEQFAPLIEERLQSYLKLNGVFKVQNADYAQQLLREKLKSIMDEMINKMQTENIRQQREVDSTEEYTRLAHVCDSELSRIAERFRQSRR